MDTQHKNESHSHIILIFNIYSHTENISWWKAERHIELDNNLNRFYFTHKLCCTVT